MLICRRCQFWAIRWRGSIRWICLRESHRWLRASQSCNPHETETTVDDGRGKTVRVTLVEPQIGKRRLKSWCWQLVSRLSPSINKNVLCLVKQRNGKTCDHLMKWTPSDGSKKGTGTSGLIKHLEVSHSAVVKKNKDEIGTSGERKALIRAAIGECFEKEKKTCYTAVVW